MNFSMTLTFAPSSRDFSNPCNKTICVVGNSYKWFANKKIFPNYIFYDLFYEGIIFHELFSNTLTFAPASSHFSNPL